MGGVTGICGVGITPPDGGLDMMMGGAAILLEEWDRHHFEARCGHWERRREDVHRARRPGERNKRSRDQDLRESSLVAVRNSVLRLCELTFRANAGRALLHQLEEALGAFDRGTRESGGAKGCEGNDTRH